VSVAALTHDEIIRSLFHHGGVPAHLTVKPRSGPSRALDCFASESSKPASGRLSSLGQATVR
jgi:hypothetical protein